MSLAQRKLLAELKSLYAEAQTAADELPSLQRSAELGAESLRLITLRYKNGESTVLEVVDAQNDRRLADTAYKTARCAIVWRWPICKRLREN